MIICRRIEENRELMITSNSSNFIRSPPVQWILGALSLGVKWPGRKANHSTPSSAEVKNVCTYTFTPTYIFMVWCLIEDETSSWHGTQLSTETTLPLLYLVYRSQSSGYTMRSLSRCMILQFLLFHYDSYVLAAQESWFTPFSQIYL